MSGLRQWSQYRLKISSNPCFVLSTSAPSCSSPLSSATRGSTSGSEAFSNFTLSCSAIVNSADSCSGVTRVVITPAGTKLATHTCLSSPTAVCKVVPFTPNLPDRKYLQLFSHLDLAGAGGRSIQLPAVCMCCYTQVSWHVKLCECQLDTGSTPLQQ